MAVHVKISRSGDGAAFHEILIFPFSVAEFNKWVEDFSQATDPHGEQACLVHNPDWNKFVHYVNDMSDDDDKVEVCTWTSMNGMSEQDRATRDRFADVTFDANLTDTESLGVSPIE